MRRGGGGRGGGRIPKNRSIAPTPARKPYGAGVPSSSRRESDASLCSNRLSSASLPHAAPCPPISDRAYQSSALRSVNAYLTSISSAALRPPLPSARDIAKAFDDVLSRLDWVPSGVGEASVLEDDLPFVLSSLRCPIKLSKSALKAPGTPHSWPPLLAALHWLVQLARWRDSRSASQSSLAGNDELRYISQSYSLFMEGEDEAVEALDQEKFRSADENLARETATLEAMEKEVVELEKIVEANRSAPSEREKIEQERAMLKDDLKKFDVMREAWNDKILVAEKLLKEKEEGLEAKIREKQRISADNEDLRKKIASQVMNVRDAERMKKELQAVERDVAEAEIGRNVLEEQSWELDADNDRKLKELESMVEQANYTIKKLKLGCEFQYALKTEETSASEILGKDYKTVLKPFIIDTANETKKNSVAKFEEKISLQQQSRANSVLLDEKNKRLAFFQKKIDEAEMKSILLKRDVDEHISRCSADAGEMIDGMERREREICVTEDEAENFLKECEGKLGKSERDGEEEIQTSVTEFLGLVDSVVEYKEFMESLVGGMMADLSATAQDVVEAHKAHLSSMLVPAPPGTTPGSSKRPRTLLANSPS